MNYTKTSTKDLNQVKEDIKCLEMNIAELHASREAIQVEKFEQAKAKLDKSVGLSGEKKVKTHAPKKALRKFDHGPYVELLKRDEPPLATPVKAVRKELLNSPLPATFAIGKRSEKNRQTSTPAIKKSTRNTNPLPLSSFIINDKRPGANTLINHLSFFTPTHRPIPALTRAHTHLLSLLKENIVGEKSGENEQLNLAHYYIYHLRQWVIAVYDLSLDNRQIKEFRDLIAHYLYGLPVSNVFEFVDIFREMFAEMEFSQEEKEKAGTMAWYILLLEKFIDRTPFIAESARMAEAEKMEQNSLMRPVSITLGYIELLTENYERYQSNTGNETDKAMLYDIMLTQLIEIGEQFHEIDIQLKNDACFDKISHEFENYRYFRLLRNAFMHDPQAVHPNAVLKALENFALLQKTLMSLQQKIEELLEPAIEPRTRLL